MSTRAIYLDHSATTPLDSSVLAAMMPYLCEEFGNASGAYSLGRRAKSGLETARRQVAEALGCLPSEVVFTSGGSEADNLALRGAALAAADSGRGRHLITCAIEHEAILATMHQLEERFGFEVTVVGVDSQGRVRVEEILASLKPETTLVSIMLANNEVGTLQPIGELGGELRRRGIVFHTDAVQAAPWVDLNVDTLNVDLMSLSAHKFYGPKGVGALYVRQGTPLLASQTGGGQERGLRSGTYNVAGAVGLAAALTMVTEGRPAAVEKAARLRDRLVVGLTAMPQVQLTGHPTERLAGHASFCIGGVRADALLLGLDMRGIAASSGSACHAGRLEPSHVLSAMGLPADLAVGAVRFSLGRHTSAEDVDTVLDVLPPLIGRMRRIGS